MTDKEEQLLALSDAAYDIYQFLYKKDKAIGSEHHILYTGNLDAKIVVVKMHPNNTETFWAERNNTHGDHLFNDEDGKAFKHGCSSIGFKPNDDFLFTTLMPFYNKNVNGYTPQILREFGWIFTGLLDIIKPDIVMALGYKTFSGAMANFGYDVNLEDFEVDIAMGEPFYFVDKMVFAGLPDKCFSTKNNSNILRKLYNYYTKEKDGRT